MEYGLRVLLKVIPWMENQFLVLILVLMEYGLRDRQPSPVEVTPTEVLILVLMEYGLRGYRQSPGGSL